MKKLIFFAGLLAALFIFTACAEQKAMSLEEKRVEKCAMRATGACKLTAKEVCKSKTTFQKMACEEASKEACMQTARSACK